jgi:hypothetical protein
LTFAVLCGDFQRERQKIGPSDRAPFQACRDCET